MQFVTAILCFTSEPGAQFWHDPWPVALSISIAAIGVYAAFDMAARRRGANGRMAQVWRLSGAATMGGSIWSTHFIGMLASRTIVPVTYDPWNGLLSLVIAVVACGIGLQIVNGPRDVRPRRLLLAGCVVGAGALTMHYVGMASMHLPGTLAYTPGLWSMSVLVAVAGATAALWIAARATGAAHRGTAALVMAGAICGMHYIGMAATVIRFDAVTVSSKAGWSPSLLSVAVAAVAFALVLLALACVAAHRRLHAAVEQATEFQLVANKEIVRRLCAAGEFRDDDTGHHVWRIGVLAERLAQLSGFDTDFVALLREAAPLHDIGKVGIPDCVLLKPGKLTDQEWDIMRTHVHIGERILGGSGMQLLDLAAEIALSHHERWDGGGYPHGLTGEAIPLAGRIVAVVDVFDALLSSRSYKEPWTLSKVEEHFRIESGRHFEPRLVSALLDHVSEMVALRRGCVAPSMSIARAAATTKLRDAAVANAA